VHHASHTTRKVYPGWYICLLYYPEGVPWWEATHPEVYPRRWRGTPWYILPYVLPGYTPPVYTTLIHPGYTILPPSSALGVSVATSVVSEHSPGLRKGETRGWRAFLVSQDLRCVSKSGSLCA